MNIVILRKRAQLDFTRSKQPIKNVLLLIVTEMIIVATPNKHVNYGEQPKIQLMKNIVLYTINGSPMKHSVAMTRVQKMNVVPCFQRVLLTILSKIQDNVYVTCLIIIKLYVEILNTVISINYQPRTKVHRSPIPIMAHYEIKFVWIIYSIIKKDANPMKVF